MSGEARWHAALAYAILGRRLPLTAEGAPNGSVGGGPDLEAVANDLLERAGGGDALRNDVAATRRGRTDTWPYALPDDLRAGIPAAQFSAALRALIERLGVQPYERRVRADRRLTPEERALSRDVPPHHGGD